MPFKTDQPDDSLGPVDDFRRTGLKKLDKVLPEDLVTSIRRKLELLPVFASSSYVGSDRMQRTLDDTRRISQFASYSTDQLLRIPSLLRIFMMPAILDFVEKFMGCVPTLYSLNAWWSFPAPTASSFNSQFFHRDNDDWRWCVLFIYLTDVDESGGPHQFIEGSQTLAGMQALAPDLDAANTFLYSRGEKFSARCEKLPITTLTGPAGTMILANTLAIHRGLVPSQKPRLMLWGRYGFGPNTNSVNLEMGPLGHVSIATNLLDTPRNRYIARLLVDFDRVPWSAAS